MYLDGKKIGDGKIGKTNANTFGIDESAEVGVDENKPVFLGDAKREKFTGKILKVDIETFPQRNNNASGLYAAEFGNDKSKERRI